MADGSVKEKSEDERHDSLFPLLLRRSTGGEDEEKSVGADTETPRDATTKTRSCGQGSRIAYPETHLGKKVKATKNEAEREDEDDEEEEFMDYIDSFLESDDEKEQRSLDQKNNILETRDEEEQRSMDHQSLSESEDDQRESENEIIEETEEETFYDHEVLQDKTCLELGYSQRPKIYKTYFDSRSRGVAILVNKPHICLKAYSEGGDFAWIYTEIDEEKYTFVSVYYHNMEKPEFMWRILYSFLLHGPKAWTESRLVIGGDFNTTLNSELDLVDENPGHEGRRKILNKFLSIVNLADVWREKNKSGRKYTFSCNDPKSRLDYVFMLQKDLENVKDCDIPVDQTKFRKLSDHYPVVLTLTTK
ncbi:hypothetical protein IRJ41_005286 [Triplophysa rosa]|uniref:Endonuclease/exonuclease/phosphatase domain-containing protein n=1 Tax=Triplophysa rosa TaxID=992332 RepID=A0A9W7W910_TRIRA|nr:hypothetical protein IRJ41_005286 [Triplophysa rosa]